MSRRTHRECGTVLILYEVLGAIFNDLEQPLIAISRSRHSLTVNISKTAKDTVIVAIEGE